MLSVEALPAGDGDSLWIEWTAADGVHRMLVDGGRSPSTVTARLARQPQDRRRFDVVVCTHIDLDHIGGLLPVMRRPPPGFAAADLWFNGRGHLVRSGWSGDVLGTRQGRALTLDLVRTGQPWNVAFGGGPVVVPDTGPLPEVPLPGLTVTLLGPGRPQLARLLEQWREVVVESRADQPADVLGRREHADTPLVKLAELDFVPETKPANGSSIVLLLRHDDGSRVLLCADAHAAVLVAGLRRLEPAGPVAVDLCKLPHHGSAANVSPAFLDALSCRHWLVSTNGALHDHPDRAALARVLVRRGEPTLWFNYRTATTVEFGEPDVTRRWGSRAEYPDDGAPGIRVEIEAGRVRRGAPRSGAGV